MRRQFTALLQADIRQSIRDKSFFIFGIAVPLALMTVLNLVVGASMNPDLDEIDVAVSSSSDDPAGAAIVGALGSIETDDGFSIALTELDEQSVRAAVEDGEAGLGVIVPTDLMTGVAQGTPGEITILQPEGSLETVIAGSVVEGIAEQLNAGAQATGAAVELGAEPATIGTLVDQVASAEPSVTLEAIEPPSEQLDPSAQLVAGQAGLFLIFTVGFGVLSLLTEREQGTLSRLHSMPMRPGLVVASKATASFILGIVATSFLLTAGSLMFDVSFGSIPLVALLVLGATAAATGLMFIVIRVVRNAEQASVAQSILAMVLGMAGGAFFPIAATGVLATIIDLNPIAAFIRGLGIVSGGGGLGDLGVPLLTLAGFAALCFAISRVIPDRGVAA